MNAVGTSLTLSSNWLDNSITPTVTNVGNAAVFGTANTGYCYGGYWYPYYQPGLWITETSHRPIRLTMSEVERLRVAAKKDKELRATLEKFTDHIEVVVDFK